MSAPYPLHPPAALPAPPRLPRWREPRPWIQGFVVFQLVCQLALLSGVLAPFRLGFRMAAFGSSLALLLLLRGAGKGHPSAGPALLALTTLAVAVFHPETTNLTAGVAQAALYAAILAPVFWVPRLGVTMRTLRRTVLILWAFHSLSAGLGVLQVYFPGRFQPNVSSVVLSKGRGYIESLKITTASGERVFRPMGLTDIPGGASISGLYAVLFGIGFFLTRRTPGMLAAAMASMGVGMMCLYLSQVRALVVFTGIAVVVIAGVLAWRRDVGRLAAFAGGVGTVLLLGWTAANSLAGPTVARRMAALVRDRPTAVYYSERGRFLDEALNEWLPNAPLGEGLGHWGMMATYFPAAPGTGKPIWVEIQWAGWIVDGGIPLVLTYVAAILVALLAAWRAVRGRPPRGAEDLPFWGAIVLAHGVGALALTFSYPIFVSQSGMEFWLLNATLVAAARHARQVAAETSG